MTLCLAAAMALAAPLELPVTGVLTDATGSALDGAHDLDVRLIAGSADPAGRSFMITATLDGGRFQISLPLDDQDDAAMLRASDLALSVGLVGQPLSAAVPVGWAPRAAWARSAGSLDGLTAGDLLTRADVASDGGLTLGAGGLGALLPEGSGLVASADGLSLDWSALDDAYLRADQPDLAIDGAVRLGAGTATTCDASTRGTLRYDAGAFLGCTATGWVTVGAPAPAGSTASLPAASCAAVIAADPAAPSADYWIGSSSPTLTRCAFTARRSTFTYSPSVQYFNVPEGVEYVTVKVWGAGGGGGRINNGYGFDGYAGGGGGYTDAVINVGADTGITRVAIVVGAGGKAGMVRGQGTWTDDANPNLMGGGGQGSPGFSDAGGGGGGGYSGLFKDGSINQANAIVLAGGGGGGGRNEPGAAGGGTSGANAPLAGNTPYYGGGGGTQTAGGTAGPAPVWLANGTANHTGGALFGGSGGWVGNGDGGAGGGGGGWFGGGGGGTSASGNGPSGGGGGSGYSGSSVVVSGTATSQAGSTRTPAQSTNTDYPGSNIGYGGLGRQAGSPGAVIVMW